MHLKLSSNFIQRFITGTILGIGFWFILVYLPTICFSLLLLLILILIILFEWPTLFSIRQRSFWGLMPFYLLVPFFFLISLNHSPEYHDLLYILFILVFSFDTGSYLIGNIFGKHHILPSISPKKTWEGAVGGCLFAYVGCLMIQLEQQLPISLVASAFITVIICSLALCGDFFESYLKRKARIKDSGKLLPGHGGLLDRFDGIIFAVFFFYFFKELLSLTFLAH